MNPDDLAAAVAATEGEGTARVWRRRFSDPPLPPGQDFFAAEDAGVTDFNLRRTLMTDVELPGAGAVLAMLTKRWPWLAAIDDDEDEEHAEESAKTLHAGTSHYLRSGGVWIALSEGDPAAPRRTHTDPLWIADVLRLADETWPTQAAVARGAACTGIAFRTDLNAHRDALEIPPFKPYSQPPRVTGEVAVDDLGRIRRVTWSEIPRRRRRGRGRTAGVPSSRLWQVVELWDFGLTVQIELPHVHPAPNGPPWPVALAGIAHHLWQIRRRYLREQG